MLPDAYISHLTSKRLRIKIPSKKGDKTYFLSLRDQFSKYQGVEKLEVNPLTGSALFIHAVDINAIAQYAETNHLFRLGTSNLDTTPLVQKISGTLKDLNNQVKDLSGGGIDLPSLAFLGLLGSGLWQISRGNVTAIPWYTAFWYALGVFSDFQLGKGSMDKQKPIK